MVSRWEHSQHYLIFAFAERIGVKIMRARLIQAIPGLDPEANPFERLQQFAGRIVRVSKIEVDKEIINSGSLKPKAGPKRKKA